jgi:predicted AlkP superfamily pyrophosphatase or phosphodiesterase
MRSMRRGAAWLVWVLAGTPIACVPSPRADSALDTPAPSEPPGPIQHVLLVTIDGLLPESYLHPDAHALRIPTLRYLAAHGAVSPGARSVFPSVTYPSHTSMVTGVMPGRHGITTNAAFDPLEKNFGGWRWYTEDLKVAPVWELARRAGYRTGLVSWPVTAGARATWLFPEYWRARNDDDRKLVRTLSTPHLLDDVARAHPDLWSRLLPDPRDDAIADIAAYVIEQGHPHLMLVHLVDVDENQHAHGLWSPQAIFAIEEADRQLARLMQSLRESGLWSRSAIIVASDHGFAGVTRRVRPGVLLREAGLVRVNEKNEPVEWKAAVLASSGQAYVYLRSPADAAVAETVTRIFSEQVARPGSGIGRVYDRDQIRAVGGDPDALLALEASDGVYFGPGYGGDYETPAAIAATHGYDPGRPAMQASLLLIGPGIPAGPIAGARLVDIAPTIAQWLGLSMPDVDGRALAPISGTSVRRKD